MQATRRAIAKANPTSSDVYVDSLLTNISTAYVNDAAGFVASQVFPVVSVRQQTGLFWRWSKDSFLRTDAKATTGRGDIPKRRTDLAKGTYAVEVFAIGDDVSEQELANQELINLETAKTNGITEDLMINKEKDWGSKYWGASIWTGEDLLLRWGDSGSDPIGDIKRASTAMLKRTGVRPNTLTLGVDTMDTLELNPSILDRLKYGQTQPNPADVTTAALAQLFRVDRVIVGEAIEVTDEPDPDAATDYTSAPVLNGADALLTYSPAAPALQTLSAGYTMQWSGLTGGGAAGTRMISYPSNNGRLQNYEGDINYDHNLVSADCGHWFGGVAGST